MHTVVCARVCITRSRLLVNWVIKNDSHKMFVCETSAAACGKAWLIATHQISDYFSFGFKSNLKCLCVCVFMEIPHQKSHRFDQQQSTATALRRHLEICTMCISAREIKCRFKIVIHFLVVSFWFSWNTRFESMEDGHLVMCFESDSIHSIFSLSNDEDGHSLKQTFRTQQLV